MRLGFRVRGLEFRLGASLVKSEEILALTLT